MASDQQQQQPARAPMTAERLAGIANTTKHARTVAGPFSIWMQVTADTDYLLAFAEAALPILRAVAECEAVRSPVFEPGGIEGIVLHHESRNVLWMREQARALLAGTGEGAEGSEQG